MRTLALRVVTVSSLSLVFLLTMHASVAAQRREPPLGVAIALEPPIATQVEALLAAPNTVLVTDYYYVDTRFGPNLRIDAVIVEAVGSPTRVGEPARVKGLRLQVRDKENRSRQEGTSYMDLEELMTLSRSLTSMAELAEKWTSHDDRRASELAFTSAGGFRLAIRQSARLPRAYLSTGLLDPVSTSIDITELGTLKVAFDEALSILNSK
jgi:hypothetical protein